MKNLTFLIAFLAFNISYNQQTDSFLEDFRDEYFHETGIINFGLSSLQYPNGIDDTSAQINSAKNYSWQVDNSYSNFGNSLKLTVHPEDHAQNATYPRSRAEIFLNLNNQNHNTYYYSWKMFVPEDNEFIDDTSAGYHIITQILNTKYSNGSPLNITVRKLLTVQYNQNSESADQPRDLGILLFDNDSSAINIKSSRINITDAIYKGEWNEFIFKIHWSEYDVVTNNKEPGSIEFYINRKPLILQSTDNSTAVETFTCTVSDQESDPNVSFVFPNMTYTEDTDPVAVSNALKLGHYRNEHTLNHSLYIDDIRITSEFPPEYNKTKLTPESCDIEFNTDFTIECLPVPEATHYVFRFEKDGIVNFKGNGSSTILNLENLSFIEHDATYEVSVRAQRIISGITEYSYGYGESCSIHIPKKSTLKESYCDKTLPIENLSIEAKPILNATHYIFKFDNNGTINYKGNGPNTVVDLNNLTFIESNTSYNVQVRAERIINGITEFSYPYGDVCQVTVPFITRLDSQYCSASEPLESPIISAYPVPQANRYIFSFENSNGIFYHGNGSHVLNLEDVPEIQENQLYSVKVRAMRIVNEQTIFSYGYGDSCNILTPNLSPIFFKAGISFQNSAINKIPIGHNIAYPNPFSNYLTILSEKDFTLMLIYDTSGKITYTGYHTYNDTWDLSFLPKGVYFVKLVDNGKVIDLMRVIKSSH